MLSASVVTTTGASPKFYVGTTPKIRIKWFCLGPFHEYFFVISSFFLAQCKNLLLFHDHQLGYYGLSDKHGSRSIKACMPYVATDAWSLAIYYNPDHELVNLYSFNHKKKKGGEKYVVYS
jgi:hypothetical protein